MFEDSQVWISAKASEIIKNNSICIYEPNTKTIRNIKNRDEIATNVFVFVDEEIYSSQCPPHTPDIVNVGEYARCLRINIGVAG